MTGDKRLSCHACRVSVIACKTLSRDRGVACCPSCNHEETT